LETTRFGKTCRLPPVSLGGRFGLRPDHSPITRDSDRSHGAAGGPRPGPANAFRGTRLGNFRLARVVRPPAFDQARIRPPDSPSPQCSRGSLPRLGIRRLWNDARSRDPWHRTGPVRGWARDLSSGRTCGKMPRTFLPVPGVPIWERRAILILGLGNRLRYATVPRWRIPNESTRPGTGGFGLLAVWTVL